MEAEPGTNRHLSSRCRKWDCRGVTAARVNGLRVALGKPCRSFAAALPCELRKPYMAAL